MEHARENTFQAAVDRFGQSVFEARLASLAERGFSVELRVSTETFGKNAGKTLFHCRLQKGDAYAGSGSSMSATGSGLNLDAAVRSALRSAETFLQDGEPPAAVDGALGDLICPMPAISVGERV